MFKYLLQGFILGLAYVAPIGMQNLYVINSAILGNKLRAYQVAVITAFFDITLALACYFGVGLLLEYSEVLRKSILFIGAIAVITIGMCLMRSIPETNNNVGVEQSLLRVSAVCFAVTWLNPQAIIDGSLLLGGFKASLSSLTAQYFIIGVCMASLSWFMFLTTVVLKIGSNINHKLLRMINVVCGLVIVLYGIKLMWSFLEAVGLVFNL